MAQSKMVKFSPRLDGSGNHRNYEGSHGKMYTFDVEFTNGDKGEASSPNMAPKWVTGNEYTYNVETNEHGTKIKGMKMVKDGASSPSEASSSSQYKQGYQKSPEEQRRISMQVAYEAATDIIISNIDAFSDDDKYPAGVLKSAIEANAKEFCEWIMKGTTTNEYITRSNALKRAIIQMEIIQFDISSKTKILERAEEIFRFLWI